MSGGDSLELARSYAVQAMKAMQQQGLAPTPASYALWYAYAASSVPGLNAEVDALLAATGKMTQEDATRLHAHFFTDDEERAALEQVSNRIEQALRSLVENVGTAEQGAASYGATLDSISGALTKVDEGKTGDLGKLVSTLANETQRMVSLSRTLEDRLNQSTQEITKLRNDLEVVREEANTDALTTLANRKMFDRELKAMAQRACEKGRLLCLLILDIDHFKVFNDTHGHQTGDHVLRLVARTLSTVIGEAGLVARMGGEEFAILLPDTGLGQAKGVAEQARSTMASKVLRNRKTNESLGAITLSIGVAEYALGEDLSLLIERADEAMYLAKRAGRNQVKTQAELS